MKVKKGKAFKTVLLIILASIFTFSVYQIVDIHLQYLEGERLYADLSNQYVVPGNTEDTIPDSTEDTASDSTEETGPLQNDDPIEAPPITVDFDSLLKQNKDVVGWLYCENTPINYPVVQGQDNDYYLHRMLNGKYNIAGTIFMDYRCNSDCSSLNTIIYGHNMKNDTMFGTLTDYNKQTYFDEHPVLWFLTPQADYKIELIAGYVTPSTSDAYKNFYTPEELQRHIEASMEKSTFETSADVDAAERIITLSTCTYEYSTARYVVIGIINPVNAEITANERE